MKVLFVCHRVPFPPKRGGKIRPFNIIRHLHEQGHEVTVASLARNQAEARRVGRAARPLQRPHRRGRGGPRRLAAHGGVAADDASVELRVLLFAAARSAASTRFRRRRRRLDLRALLVGRAVRGRPAVAGQDHRLRRHGLAEVARVLAPQALSAVGRLLARGGQARAHGAAARREVRPVHLHHARRDGDAPGTRRQASRRAGFRTASMRSSSSRIRTAPTIRISSRSSAAWTISRTSKAVLKFCAEVLPELQRRRPSTGSKSSARIRLRRFAR